LRAHAADLLARFQETVDITFLDEDKTVVIESLVSPQALRAVSYIGARLPLHCTAHGKAHLSTVEPARRRALLKRSLERLTEQTNTDPDKILAEIDASAAQGYFVDISQTTDGLSAVAVALDDSDFIDYAIGIVAPSNRFNANLNAYVEKLFEVRRGLSAASRRFPVRRY